MGVFGRLPRVPPSSANNPAETSGGSTVAAAPVQPLSPLTVLISLAPHMVAAMGNAEATFKVLKPYFPPLPSNLSHAQLFMFYQQQVAQYSKAAGVPIPNLPGITGVIVTLPQTVQHAATAASQSAPKVATPGISSAPTSTVSSGSGNSAVKTISAAPAAQVSSQVPPVASPISTGPPAPSVPDTSVPPAQVPLQGAPTASINPSQASPQ